MFRSADLWKYIDGGAEKYLQAGFDRVLTAEYQAGAVGAVADVFVMTGPEAARRIYESEPAGESRPLPLGQGGRLYRASAVFRQGPYLVRVVAFQDTPRLGDLAGAVSAGLR